MLRSRLSTRIPDLRSIVLVFAVVSLVLYGWTFVSIFWLLNSWVKNLTIWEIFSVISYSMVHSFLESAAVIMGMLSLSVILPSRFWKEKFTVRGSIVALCILSSMMLQLKLYADGVDAAIVTSLEQWWFVTLLVTVILSVFLPMFRVTEKIVQEIADRTVVFLYLFLPVTLVGFFVVLLRFFVTSF